MSESTPVHYVQEGLVTFHDTTGLPWWATIIISTITLRTLITLPLTVYQYKVMGRLEKIGQEFPKVLEELKKETAYAVKKFNWTEKQAKVMFAHSARKQWNNLVIRDNCHPAKTAVTIWFQLPLWVIQSVAIRNIVYCMPDPNSIEAKMTLAELTVGGFGWIPNLTEVDASYILPVTLGIVNLLVIQIQTSIRKAGPPSKLQNIATNAFRVLSIVMVPIAATVPSCLCLYWVSSSMYGLGQNLAFISPKIRRLFGVPQLSHLPKENPYRNLVHRMFNKKETQ
uniref:CSON006167 protein n=1 Tax=Culicoides sonorensis TaxID=179676 RepID=A0A336MUR6_CULSO